MSASFVLLLAAAALLLVGGIIGLVFLLFFLLGGSGGWRCLVERYATSNAPTGHVLARQTIKIGAVTYKRCATLGVATEGLYVRVWRKTVVIPWREFTGLGQETLFWQKMPKLTVGAPPVATITLPPSLLPLLRERLPADLG